MLAKVFLFVCFALSLHTDVVSSDPGYLTLSDKDRLKNVFSWDLNDVPSLHYAVRGYKLLGLAVPKPQDICKSFLNLANTAAFEKTILENLFYASSGWHAVGNCQGTLPTSKFVEAANKVFKQDKPTITDLYYAVGIFKSLGQKLTPHASFLKTKLAALLKNDDSVLSLSYIFHIASNLGKDAEFAYSKIGDAIIQADEVNGQYLQYEGGLSVTAFLVSGVFKLTEAVGKPLPLTSDQTIKFSNYFLSRRTVLTSKGAFNLLEVVTLISENKFIKPVAITLEGSAAVSAANPKVLIKVSDILGRPISNSRFAVTAESASRVSDDVIVLSKKKFEPVPSDNSLYSINLMEVKPDPGFYKISINAIPPNPDPRIAGNVGVSLAVKVMYSIAIDSLEIGIADADQTTQPKLEKLMYSKKIPKILEADTQQKLVVKFAIKDKSTNKEVIVNQAFIKFNHKETNEETIFIAEHDSNSNIYRLDLDIGAKLSQFSYLTGVYSVDLIVGDVVASNSFVWNFADVNLKVLQDSAKAVMQKEVMNNALNRGSVFKPKPEIQHLFREPEKRPPVFVSNLFTGLIFFPFLVLIALWGKIGVNISNFPISLSAIGFHLGLGGIFVLFGFFWLQLNMFQTLKYLLGLGVVTFLCGNKLLSKIAESRKH